MESTRRPAMGPVRSTVRTANRRGRPRRRVMHMRLPGLQYLSMSRSLRSVHSTVFVSMARVRVRVGKRYR